MLLISQLVLKAEDCLLGSIIFRKIVDIIILLFTVFPEVMERF